MTEIIPLPSPHLAGELYQLPLSNGQLISPPHIPSQHHALVQGVQVDHNQGGGTSQHHALVQGVQVDHNQGGGTSQHHALVQGVQVDHNPASHYLGSVSVMTPVPSPVVLVPHPDPIQVIRLQNTSQSVPARSDVTLVTGYVVTVMDDRNTNSKIARFTIRSPKSGRITNAVYNGFCPIRSGDVVSCMGVFEAKTNTIMILQPPLVRLPIDKESIIKGMYSAFFRDKAVHGGIINKLYEKLQTLVDNRIYTRYVADGVRVDEIRAPEYVHDVDELLSLLSGRWMRYKNTSLLVPLTEVLGSPPTAPTDNHVRATTLLEWWDRSRVMRQLYLLGFNNGDIKEICDESGLGKTDLYERMLYNPYTVPQVKMEKCIEIDGRTGRVPTPTDFFCGTISREVWTNFSKRGWMCTTWYSLKRKYPWVSQVKDLLVKDYGLVIDEVENGGSTRNETLNPNQPPPPPRKHKYKVVYLRRAYLAEVAVAKFLELRMKDKTYDPTTSSLKCQFELPINIQPGVVCDLGEPSAALEGLDEGQVAAVQMSLKSGVSSITGHAGVGKTTVLKAIVSNYIASNTSYMLVSFTGKAVSRIRQVVTQAGSDRIATMHRMIASPSRYPSFKKLIIDEASMVTTALMYDFLITFGTDFDICLVGDSGQLPPIDAGSMFNELLMSRTITRTTLTVCHRTRLPDGQVDGILENCNRIAGWPDGMTFQPHIHKNFIMDDSNETKVIELIKQFKAGNVPLDQFAIISPYKRCLTQLNRAAQLVYNGTRPTVTDQHKCIWYEGDRVRMTVNNYDINVMNGEEGIIQSVKSDAVVVDFGQTGEMGPNGEPIPSRVVEIPFVPKRNDKNKRKYEDDTSDQSQDQEDKNQLHIKNITLSYAMTVHSSQGSEYLFVIFMMPMDAKPDGGFLNRNLIYTGLSRARRMCIAVGNMTVLCMTVGKGLPYRCEHLADRLRLALTTINEIDVRTQVDVYETNDEEYPEGMLDNWDL
jgi:hypothetical protein